MISIKHILGVFTVLLLTACAKPNPASAPPNPAPYSFVTAAGLRLHVLQTGWVSVKRRFRDIGWMHSLRVASIVADRRWTEWLPIQFFVIEHPEGTIVFDTGESANSAHAEYFNCDSATRWFYTSQLQFAVKAEDELGPQLKKIGIDPNTVRWTILSHLHSDHIGGLRYLKNSTVFISARDAPGHSGALLCRIPTDLTLTYVDYQDGPFGAFQSSHSVTSQGTVRIVPTPGHTKGHQSLMYREDKKYYLMAGDVVFDFERLNSGHGLAGIVEDVTAAKKSIRQLEQQLHELDTFIAPSHDHRVSHRFHSHR